MLWSLSWSSSLLIGAVIFGVSSSLSLSLHGTGPCWVSLSFFLSPASLRHKEAPVEERAILLVEVILHNDLFWAPLATHNPNLQVVITHTLNEWNSQSAIWSHTFRPSTPCNLFTRVLTICQVKFTQSTEWEQKRLYLQSSSPALHNPW